MPSEKEIARNAHLRRALGALAREYGFDGCVLLCYSHTDDEQSMTHYASGHVPAMADVITSVVHLISVTAYDVGRNDGIAQALGKPITNLDSEKQPSKTVT